MNEDDDTIDVAECNELVAESTKETARNTVLRDPVTGKFLAKNLPVTGSRRTVFRAVSFVLSATNSLHSATSIVSSSSFISHH